MAKTLIGSAHTASGSPAVITITGIDDTYDVYEFHLINIHPVDDNVDFSFQVNAGTNTGYNDSLITSTHFTEYHHETNGTTNGPYYDEETDLAQLANEQILGRYFGNEDDESGSGVLTLYDPSSPTYVKHFTSRIQVLTRNEYFHNRHIAGYINDTTAVVAIRFKFSSGSIDAGEIKMFGVT